MTLEQIVRRSVSKVISGTQPSDRYSRQLEGALDELTEVCVRLLQNQFKASDGMNGKSDEPIVDVSGSSGIEFYEQRFVTQEIMKLTRGIRMTTRDHKTRLKRELKLEHAKRQPPE